MLEEVSHSGLNGKKMRNQMRRADRILSTLRSFLLSCESPQGREAPVQAAASLGGTDTDALRVQTERQPSLLRPPNLSASRTPQKALQDCAALPANPSQHLHQSSSSREKGKRADTEPGQPRAY